MKSIAYLVVSLMCAISTLIASSLVAVYGLLIKDIGLSIAFGIVAIIGSIMTRMAFQLSKIYRKK
jgi:hypothetical protein